MESLGKLIGSYRLVAWILTAALCASGCGFLRPSMPMDAVDVAAPNERAKTILPPYVISPPDVLQINAVQLVPKPPYHIKSLDVLFVQFPAEPDLLTKQDLEDLLKTGRVVSGNFTVRPDGTIDLGAVYGKVEVYNLTIEQAQKVVEKKMMQLTNPKLVKAGKVTVDLFQSRGMQQILGDHLVRPDGSISLGTYGDVTVAGMTLFEAKKAIEQHLSRYLKDPEVTVDVSGYNSQVYYVIFDGGGFGEQVLRLPVTGNETVLDAIGQVQGLPSVASRSHIWIARPNRHGNEDGAILPVDWKAITRRGNTTTNYQLLPGDRLYVMAEPLITTNTYIDRVIAPVERVMGFSLLGAAVHRTFRFIGSSSNVGFGGLGF